VQTRTGLNKQSLIAAAVAAYVGALVSFLIFQVWRYQTGADASMCPAGSADLRHWCGIGELSLAFVFDFLWALYGFPFALVLTAPCALALGQLAPSLEREFTGRTLALVQYGLAAAVGLIAGLLLGAVAAGLAAAGAGVWVFRRTRYLKSPPREPMVP
jgi:hypothetical protein